MLNSFIAPTPFSATVVIPTYNEANNIKKLIPKLYDDIFPRIERWKVNVVIVDGNSEDGTAGLAETFIGQFPSLSVIREPQKRGIGSAYMTGFNFAVNNLHSDVVIEFDGDFQHPPEEIENLLDKIDGGYDFVVGSRFIKGGNKSTGGKLWRTLLTRAGGFLAKVILFWPDRKFRKITDPTSGLRASVVKKCFKNIPLQKSHLYSAGFGYKLQLLSEILNNGVKFTEIPLNFGVRKNDRSKIEIGTPFEILYACMWTRFNSLRTVLDNNIKNCKMK